MIQKTKHTMNFHEPKFQSPTLDQSPEILRSVTVPSTVLKSLSPLGKLGVLQLERACTLSFEEPRPDYQPMDHDGSVLTLMQGIRLRRQACGLLQHGHALPEGVLTVALPPTRG